MLSKYLDFDLRIGVANGIEYSITVTQAAAGGEPSIAALIPVDDADLRRQLDELTAVHSTYAAGRSAASVHHLSVPPTPQLSEAGITFPPICE